MAAYFPRNRKHKGSRSSSQVGSASWLTACFHFDWFGPPSLLLVSRHGSPAFQNPYGDGLDGRCGRDGWDVSRGFSSLCMGYARNNALIQIFTSSVSLGFLLFRHLGSVHEIRFLICTVMAISSRYYRASSFCTSTWILKPEACEVWSILAF